MFVTTRELYAYLRGRNREVGRYTAAMCTPIDRRFHVDRSVPAECAAEMVFSAGFRGRSVEHLAHECLHALLILRTRAQMASALSDMDAEERLLAYPFGRLMSRAVKAIWDVEDGIAFKRPVGAALKTMRRLVG